MSDSLPIGNRTTAPTDEYLSRIVQLVRKKNIIADGIADDKIKSIIRETYDLWQFYPSFGASVIRTHHRPGDEPVDDWFILRIIEMINRIFAKNSQAENRNELAGIELRAARALFDSLPAQNRDAWLERARQILSPSYHNDPDAILFTALELILNEGAIKTASRKSGLRKVLPVVILCFLFCSSPFSAEAFWPFSTSAKKPDNNLASVSRQDLGLQTNKRNYVYNYGDAVTDISKITPDIDVFIICSNCESSQLAVEIEMPPLSINVGTEPAVPTVPEVPETLTTFATSTTPIKPPAGRTPWRNTVEPVTAPVQERIAIDNPPVRQTVIREKKDSDNTCLLGRVQFDLNDFTLKPEEQQKLKDKIIQLLKSIASPIIHVHGYTCELGTKEYNDKLAMNRAKEVANFLESSGVKPVMVMGEGKCCYISDDLPANRRADITFIEDASAVDSRLCEPRDKTHLREVKKSEK